jgi:cytochrome c553
MRKKIITVLALFAFVLISFAGIDQQDQVKFKNLKVLPKNISFEELDKIMDEYNYALGVKCVYCHVKNKESRDLEPWLDTKPEKETARDMMRMTAALNKKYFNFDKKSKAPAVVTCVTCHRKNPLPPIDTMPARKR